MKFKIVAYNRNLSVFTSPYDLSIELVPGFYYSRFQNHKHMYQWSLELANKQKSNKISLLNIDKHHDRFSNDSQKIVDCGNWVRKLMELEDMRVDVSQLYPLWFNDWQRWHGVSHRLQAESEKVGNITEEVVKGFADTDASSVRIMSIDYDYFALRHEMIATAKEAKFLPGKVMLEFKSSVGYNNYVVSNEILDARSNYGKFSEVDIAKEVMEIFEALIKYKVVLNALNLTTSLTENPRSYYEDSIQAYIHSCWRPIIDRALFLGIARYTEWLSE